MDINLDIEKIRNLVKDQYQKFTESNKKLFDMLSSKEIQENWEDNYHLIDHDWILKWKEAISFDYLDKQNSDEIKNSICDFIQENTKSNYIKYLNNIEFYCLKDKKNDLMKSFDIISDEVWKLFDINNINDKYNGKVSLLKGNRKILIRLDENIYYIKYLSKIPDILFGEFIIIFNSGGNEEKEAIIKDIAKSNIYNWMRENDFKQNEKQFKINKNKITFDIIQKTNNYSNPDSSFDINRDLYKDGYKYASISKDSFSFGNSFYDSNSKSGFLTTQEFINIFSAFQNHRIIQKFDQTTNVCSLMRSLSLIEPLTSYFTDRNKELKIFSNFQSKSLLNLTRDFFLNLLFEKVKDPYRPEDFTKYVREKAQINIKEEQDPFIFLDNLMKYVNKRLNRFDSDIDYHFNDILNNINGEELHNDLEKIFNKNNSIIGKLFLGIILETYKCDKCDKKIEQMNPFNILDIDYKGIINELQNKNNSIVGFDIDNLLEFYFLRKKIENMKKPIIDCPNCGNKLIILERKIISYPEYLIIRLNRGAFNQKDGFEEKESFSLFSINYENIENLENYSSEKNINGNINSKKYTLINMVNSYKDEKKNDVRFLSICTIPNAPNLKIWIKFKCNEPAQNLKDGYKEDNESEYYILFYRLQNK